MTGGLQDVLIPFLLVTGGAFDPYKLFLLHLLADQRESFYYFNTMWRGLGYIIHRLHLPAWCTFLPQHGLLVSSLCLIYISQNIFKKSIT